MSLLRSLRDFFVTGIYRHFVPLGLGRKTHLSLSLRVSVANQLPGRLLPVVYYLTSNRGW